MPFHEGSGGLSLEDMCKTGALVLVSGAGRSGTQQLTSSLLIYSDSSAHYKFISSFPRPLSLVMLGIEL